MVADAPVPRRRLPVVAFLAFAVPGIGLAAVALASLVPTLRAIQTHAPLVAFAPRDAIGLPLAVAFLALAAMTLLPYSPPGPRRKASPARGGRAAQVCLALAAAGALATTIAAPVARLVVGAMMPSAYRACTIAEDAPRHTPLRWALAPARCP